MGDDRLSEERGAARRSAARRGRQRAEARAAGAALRPRDEDAAPSSAPPSSHRRLLGWPDGDLGCELCARRARSGTAATLDLTRASRLLLAASWVVVNVGEP